MGRARILSAIGDGQYLIQRQPNTEYRDRVLALLAQSETLAMEEQTRLDAALIEASEEVSWLRSELHDLVDTMPPPDDPDRDAHIKAITAKSREIARAAIEVSQLRIELAMTEQRLAEIDRRRAMLESATPPAQELAWCADHTVNLSENADVGTIERNDEGTSHPLIVLPGSSLLRSATFAPSDGDLRPRQWQSSEQVFFNAAVLPGVQMHRPKYRVGEITAINAQANTCTVMLDDVKSSAAGLFIDPRRELSDVPITYMGCDADAFESGDRVVVQFRDRDRDQPSVIGFESNPKPCAVRQGYTFRPADDNEPEGWPGAENSSEYWYAHADGGEVDLEDDTLLRGNAHFWRGTNNRVVSFNHGGMGRYGWRLFSTSPVPALARVPGTPGVDMLGSHIETGGRNVAGAALFRDALVIVERTAWGSGGDRLWWTANPYPDLMDEMIQGLPPKVGGNALNPTWMDAGSLGGIEMRMPWFFAPDGSKAAMVQHQASSDKDQILRLALSGGVRDPNTGILAPVEFTFSQELWGDQLETMIDTVGGESSDMVHISRAGIAGWGSKVGGVLGGGANYATGSFQWSYEYGDTDWDGSSVPSPWDEADDPPYEVVSGSCSDPPGAYYTDLSEDFGSSPHFRDLGRAWPNKVSSYSLLRRGPPENPQIALFKATVSGRPIYTALYQKIITQKIRWTVSGSALLAIDYAPNGSEIRITLSPTPETELSPFLVSWEIDRIFPCLAKKADQEFCCPSGVELDYFHHFGRFPAPPLWEGTNGPNAWGPGVANPRVAGFNPSWTVLGNPAWERQRVEQEGSLEFVLAINGVPVNGSVIGFCEENVIHFDEEFSRAWSWTIDYPDFTPSTGEFEVLDETPCQTRTYQLIDFDGPAQSLARSDVTLTSTIRRAASPDSILRIEQEREGGRLWLRGAEVSLPHAATGENPTEVLRDWDTLSRFDTAVALVQATFDPLAIGLCQRSQSGHKEMLGINVQEMRNALVVRDGSSALFSYAETDTARRAVFAQFNGVAFGLEAEIGVPTKNNLRLLDIGPV